MVSDGSDVSTWPQCSSLGEDAEGEDGLQEAEQQQRDGAAVPRRNTRGGASEVHEADRTAIDVSADPRLVLRHSGVDSWSVGLSAALAKAHHATLHPLRVVLNHQGAAGVALDTTTKSQLTLAQPITASLRFNQIING